MAHDFLRNVSETYNAKTRNTVLGRRTTIAIFLNEKYKLPRNSVETIIQKLKERGFDSVTRSMISVDVAIFRTAYLYLTGDDETQQKIKEQIRNNRPNTFGIKHLFNDGITSWEKVQKRLIKDNEQPEEKQESENLPLEQNSVSQAMYLIPMDWLEKINETLEVFSRQIDGLLEQNEDQLEKIRKQQEEIGTLKEKITELRAQPVTQEEVGKKLPHIAESVAQTKPSPRKKNPLAGFPVAAIVNNKKVRIEYHGNFRDFFASLEKGEKKQVKKAMEFIEQGMIHYKSLDTKKITKTPPWAPNNCWVSKASRQLRIVWKTEDGVLNVYSLLRHGNEREW